MDGSNCIQRGGRPEGRPVLEDVLLKICEISCEYTALFNKGNYNIQHVLYVVLLARPLFLLYRDFLPVPI